MKNGLTNRFYLQRICIVFSLFCLFSFVFACSDDEVGTGAGTPYDPSKPVKLAEFYPDSGGMATKMIIKGENFGTKAEDIRVWFNKKQASVVKSTGDMIYVITPKLPGDTCKISVAIGKDSVTFDNTFEYTTTVTVSTIAGKAHVLGSKDGTLAEAELYYPRFVAVDREKNIYVTENWRGAIRQINEEKNFAVTIHKGNGMKNPQAPSTDPEKKVIFVPEDGGLDIFEFDPDKQWAGKKMKLRPAEGENFTIPYKHCIACNVNDGYLYIRANTGIIIKFNPKTKLAYLVGKDGMNQQNSYTAFHPKQPDILYICYNSQCCIKTFNIKTKEVKLFAGTPGKPGWMDGEREFAEFKNPRQMVFNAEGEMFIADGGNQVIRKIDNNGIVSTVVGIPGIKGYKDGSPEDALFDTPEGIAVDDEDVLYIGDYGNYVVRKLAIQ